MKDYLLLLIADALLAINFAINKIYQKNAGTTFRAGFLFSALSSLFTAVIFWIYNGFAFGITLFSSLIAIGLSLLGTTYSLIGFRIMKRRGMSLYTLFLMTGGMTLPYLFGLIFLNESFSIFRLIGLLVIISGVAVSAIGKEKPDKICIILCIIVFALNGCVSIVSKIHGVYSHLAVPPQQYVVLAGIIGFVVNTVLLFSVKDSKSVLEKEREKPKQSKIKIVLNFILLPMLCAIVGGISSVLQLEGARFIDASLLYPFITGGSIVFSSLVGWIFFKEKASANMIIGVVLAFVGTLFFLQF